ncbi:MAG: 1-acyl-sn-glycerol-3-phosphate acyltransferase [Acetobacteraceae bacterium]|nr:1-acyl-sn-glycerol-3-phosphate acyltransferase [Acetobacteraceae bacterium]
MIFLRSALFNAYFLALTLLLSLAGLGVRLFAPHEVMRLARFWARMVLGGASALCGIRVAVTGRERLPEGAALIASRHESAVDTIIWLLLVPRCCYVLKKELLRVPLFGPLVRLAGMISVDRAGGASAMRALMREGALAAGQQRQIIIFPEGTRAEPGMMLPLQPGVAALAAHTRLPILPVVTNSGRLWGRRAFRKNPGVIQLALLPLIEPHLPRAELMCRLEAALRTDPREVTGSVENSVG